ncbi:COX aromatic rich motif-containing protein [Bauldia sp.]|uniref:COX aromatic rich motif-containing protein n=1 Tax=Bauldia sp. TaxID=2575872 RepID=UPI0025BCB0A2|nr:COX aromatic rich motif-containing protein [Bauldia sp.]
MRHPRASRIFAIGAICGLAALTAGCGPESLPIVFPDGPVALGERDILFRAFLIMMIVVLPVFWMAFWFSWRYRAKAKRRYEPNWDSRVIDAITWAVPFVIWASLAVHVWIYTHEYDPYLALDPKDSQLEVQVVAQDWKWLFIYPEQGVASVNELAFPAGTPLTLRITSDTVMNAFYVPALSGQIYAMAGMQSQLNLIADEPGSYRGRNTQYSGDGFADQHFEAVAMTEDDFNAWVETAKADGKALDAAAYEELAKPSSKVPVTYYSSVEPDLYQSIIQKYDSGMAAMTRAGMAAEEQASGGE